MASDNSRLIAVKILNSLLGQQGSLSTLLEKYQPDLQAESKGLIQAICFGICRQFFLLQYLIDHFLQKPLRRKDQDLYCLLLIGVYQLLFMRLPDYAVINECVDACGKLKKLWAKNLVNAVLRSVQREGDRLIDQAQSRPAVYYSHPEWLCEILLQDWPEQFLNILAANNQQAPMTLRINQSKTSLPDYCLELAALGISAQPGTLSPVALILDKPRDVHSLPGFEKGLISVQDEASQLVTQLIQARSGESILDACAAPGGKACALLESAPDVRLVAVDNDPRRMQRVEENLQRIGVHAELHCADIREQARQWLQQARRFDRILLDVPCSATGVIRRHPDIKILRQAEDLEKLVTLQRDILREVWPLLKTGGVMVYSTCSLFRAENSAQLADFLDATPDARELPIAADWGVADAHGRQLFPQAQSYDGFYYALLQKC